MIRRASKNVEKESNADCNLRDLNTMHNLMTEASWSNREKTAELPGWGPEVWIKPGSCHARTRGLQRHVCGGCWETL